MSVISIYDVKQEPYYDFFIRNGYKYLGYGYMHVIFEKDGIVYKLVRSKFAKFDKKYDYEFEKSNLDLLREHNLPTPHVIKIYDKNELVENFIVMAEEKTTGCVKNEKTLNLKNVEGIVAMQTKAHAIEWARFGQLYDKNLLFETWADYLTYLTERAKKAASIFQIPFDEKTTEKFFHDEYRYEGKACYLILDPNEENFIFDRHDKIAGIIDIDHPVCFDPLYELSVCLYAKKYIFNMRRTLQPEYFNRHLHTIKMYAYVHSLADILFLYDKDKIMFADEIKACAQNVCEFHDFLKTYT